MRSNRVRTTALGIVLVLGIFGGQIVEAATRSTSTTSPGSITATSPGIYERGTFPLTWAWKTGSLVRSNSTVEVTYSATGLQWSTIANSLPIRWGSALWDTSAVSDGWYIVRVLVRGTSIKTYAGPIMVDNHAPVVHVTRPAKTELTVDDAVPCAPVDGGPCASARLIVGVLTLEADARDAASGVASVAWTLTDSSGNATDLGEGDPLQYNFDGFTPGQYTLTAAATDLAGNVGSDSVDVIVVPGPSAISNPPAVPTPTPPVTVPDPAACQTDPAACVPGGVPSPEVPNPTPPAVPSPPSPPVDPAACQADPASCVPSP
ncbi:MAG: hypothetical protein ABR552_01780 [Actinomycetota bacterium]